MGSPIDDPGILVGTYGRSMEDADQLDNTSFGTSLRPYL